MHLSLRRSRDVLFFQSTKCGGTNMQIRQELIVSSDAGDSLSDVCTSRVASYDDRVGRTRQELPNVHCWSCQGPLAPRVGVQLIVTKSARREVAPTSRTTTRPR